MLPNYGSTCVAIAPITRTLRYFYAEHRYRFCGISDGPEPRGCLKRKLSGHLPNSKVRASLEVQAPVSREEVGQTSKCAPAKNELAKRLWRPYVGSRNEVCKGLRHHEQIRELADREFRVGFVQLGGHSLTSRFPSTGKHAVQRPLAECRG